jgi:hypothetical protein
LAVKTDSSPRLDKQSATRIVVWSQAHVHTCVNFTVCARCWVLDVPFPSNVKTAVESSCNYDGARTPLPLTLNRRNSQFASAIDFLPRSSRWTWRETCNGSIRSLVKNWLESALDCTFGDTRSSHFHSRAYECMIVLAGSAIVCFGVADISEDSQENLRLCAKSWWSETASAARRWSCNPRWRGTQNLYCLDLRRFPAPDS